MVFFFFFQQKLILSFIIFSFFAKTLTSETRTLISNQPSVYQVLMDYDFSSGLLPKGMANYDLDPSTGEFTAYFNGSCSYSLEGSYQLSFKPAIRGHISKGKLENLEGVSVKVLYFWINIVEVKRSGDLLEFSVGIASASIPVDNFQESPQYGCTFNCDSSSVSSF